MATRKVKKAPSKPTRTTKVNTKALADKRAQLELELAELEKEEARAALENLPELFDQRDQAQATLDVVTDQIDRACAGFPEFSASELPADGSVDEIVSGIVEALEINASRIMTTMFSAGGERRNTAGGAAAQKYGPDKAARVKDALAAHDHTRQFGAVRGTGWIYLG